MWTCFDHIFHYYWNVSTYKLHPTELEDIHSYVQEPLVDIITEKQACHTKRQTITLFQMAKAKQLPIQGKWYLLTELEHMFPHLLRQVMGTIAI